MATATKKADTAKSNNKSKKDERNNVSSFLLLSASGFSK